MLQKKLQAKNIPLVEPRPQFYDVANPEDCHRLEALLQEQPQTRIIDTYQAQVKELFVLNNPWLNVNPSQRESEFNKHWQAHLGGKEAWEKGMWVYAPWRATLLHILPDKEYQQVRTGRNRNLITASEQEKYYHSTVGIAGLSVGNSCALSLVLTGGAKHLRLADPDTLELTNLNRIRGSIAELTQLKVFMTARQIYELDPYADITLYPNGLTEDNIENFFEGLDIVVDEIDDIGMKVRMREVAKEKRIPIVMAADNGDGGIIDVERHDLRDDIEPFHGRAGKDIGARVIGKKLPLPVIGKIITEDLLGADVVMPKMKKSLLEIGSTLPTWPQLGSAALLNGVAVAVTVRRILTNEPIIDNRAIAALESWLIPGFNDPQQIRQRHYETQEFLKTFHERLSQATPAKNGQE